jgi:ATP-dependent DNA helicase RecQ
MEKISRKYSNRDFAPGLALYGIDGKDGVSGESGCSLFVCQYDFNDDDDDETEHITHAPSNARSQQMIHLIQAIDRKIPLDDYAEQMQLGFDEVLDSLDHLVERGTNFDITYFVDEVLDKDCQDELLDFFDENKGNVAKAIEEFYGVYRPEEIRLARLIWKP